MKTAEERATEISNERTNEQLDIRWISVEPLYAAIVQALKEQDRLTRHACAEAVTQLTGHYDVVKDEGWIRTNDAHAACMNVRAV